DDPSAPDHRRELAHTDHNLGLLLAAAGERAGAEAAYRAALAGYGRLAADAPAEPSHRRSLAVSHRSLGVLLKAQGRRAEAEAAYRAALAIQEGLAAGA